MMALTPARCYNTHMKWLRKYWPYFVLVVLLALNATIWVKREAVADWWRLRNYTPPANVAQLAGDDDMTDYAKHLFYINHPLLEGKNDFNGNCADKGVDTAVLGCYHGNRQGIYIYAVTDARLQGVEQVTAAHEMLQQAYDRLSSNERSYIDSLLEDFYKNGLTDDSIKSKIDSYKSQAGVDLVNEMHSIFGSEVRNLPPKLETYYQRYFTDRAKLASYSESYRAEFTRRQDLVKQYDAQLDNLKAQINANKATLQVEMNQLKAQESEINGDAGAHDQAKYDADIQSYNALVVTYNALLTVTKQMIDQHNQIVDQRNNIAVQEQQLQEALDSRLDSPVTQQ